MEEKTNSRVAMESGTAESDPSLITYRRHNPGQVLFLSESPFSGIKEK